MAKFCDITSRNDLADFLEIPRKVLTYVLYVKKTENFYASFEIPKKNGGTRTIKAPSGELKSIQKKLARELERYQQDIWASKGIKPNLSHGFQKKKSIVTNARIHRNKKYVLNIDLQDFFDSFHFGRVRGFFQKNIHRRQGNGCSKSFSAKRSTHSVLRLVSYDYIYTGSLRPHIP